MVYATRVNEISSHHFAQLYLTCTVQVRDPHTWQPVRYEYLKQLGTGTNPDFCLQVIKNDIQPWYLSRYTSSGAWIRTTNNADEVQRQCRYYADALAKTLETVRSLIQLSPRFSMALVGAKTKDRTWTSKRRFTMLQETSSLFRIPQACGLVFRI